MDHRSGEGRFSGWIKILAINCRQGLPNLELLDARIASAVNEIIPNSHFKKEGQSGGTDSSERGSMINDYFRVTGARDTVLDNACLFSITLRTDRCSGLRHEMVWKSIVCDQHPTEWRPGKVLQIENTWVWSTQNRIRIVRHGDSSEDIASQQSKVENHGKEEYWSETSIMKFRSQRTRELTQERWSRIERDWVALKEEKVSVTSGKKKASVPKETVAVCATKPKIARKNQNTLPPHFLSQPYHEVEVCRGREVSEAKVTWVHSSTTVEIPFERYLHANVLWILASARMPILYKWNGL